MSKFEEDLKRLRDSVTTNSSRKAPFTREELGLMMGQTASPTDADELVLKNPDDYEELGLTPFEEDDVIIAMGEWPDGSYTALVSRNTVRSLISAFDEIADPGSLRSVRVSLAEHPMEEGLYVDTEQSGPLFINNWQRTSDQEEGWDTLREFALDEKIREAK
tara:strand:+ start:68 stop:553 length:486 start_codon:yes stop_codon:yes gene_type:complete